MTHAVIEIYWIEPQAISPIQAIDFLSDTEQLKAARYHFKDDAQNWICCRASLRKILGKKLNLAAKEVPLVYQKFGKPVLEIGSQPLYFNLSHSRDLAVIAVCDTSEVGIDIEPFSRATSLLECESSFCHPHEILRLASNAPLRSAELLKIWTAKEALLKALGTGLSIPPERIQIHFQPSATTASTDLTLAGIESIQLHSLENSRFNGYSVSLACHFSQPTVIIQKFD